MLGSTLICAGLLALALACPVAAQQRAGSSGRALDRNQRSGGGRVNGTEGQVDYRARNNIITGNAPGGRSFRGNVGYTAPREFRGQIGSDSLFQFRRDSLGSSPLLRQTDISDLRDARGPSQAPSSIYRDFSGAGLSVDQNSLGDESRLNSNANVNSINSPEQLGGTGTLGDIIHGQAGDQWSGPANDFSGGGAALEASPLLGVRRYDQTQPSDGQFTSQDQAGQDNADSEDESIDDDLGYRNDQVDGRAYSGDLRRSVQLNSTRLGFGEDRASRDAAYRGSDPRDRDLPTAVVLGRQLQGFDQGVSDQRQGQLNQRISRLNDTFTGEPGADAGVHRGQVYKDLIQSLNRQASGDTLGSESDQTKQSQGPRGPDQWTNPQKQAEDESESRQASATNNSDMPERYGQGSQGSSEPTEQTMGLKAPGRRQVTEAEREASSALERMRDRTRFRGNRSATEADSNSESNNTTEADSFSMNSQLPESARRLMEKLGTDLPRVETLSEDSGSRNARLMRRAEQKLSTGNFFDAEALYRQARNNNPNNPMSLVGLVHAQMAAGLIRSASFNLRRLFENHPELINVRYQQKLLPPENRLKWLQTKLNDMLESGQGRAGPGLMLAYMGHQVRSRQLVRYGLAKAQSVAPDDPLLATARRIWLGSGADASTPDRTNRVPDQAQTPTK